MTATPAPAFQEKSPEAFRTIGEVAFDLDVPQHVLRFWESRFAQVKPVKRAGGRRYYRPEDIDLLRGIRALLYRDGLTIKGTQKILRERGIRFVAEIGRGDEMLHGALEHDRSEAASEEPRHARAQLARLERALTEDSGESLGETRRVRLELLLAQLLVMKSKLREAAGRASV